MNLQASVRRSKPGVGSDVSGYTEPKLQAAYEFGYYITDSSI